METVDQSVLQTFEDLLTTIVMGIANHPDQVTVACKQDEHGVLATIKVDPDDVRYVLGRQGDTAIAIRRLCRSFGAKYRCRLSMKIYDPNPRPHYDRLQDATQQ